MKPSSIRLKTIIIGVCLVAASALQTFAYTVNITSGFNFIGNHLNNPNNDLNTILGPSAGAIPVGSEVWKWQNGGTVLTPWLYSVYNGTTWSADLSFAPGEAVFLRTGSALTLTFSGAPATLNLPVNIGVPGDGKFYAYSDQHLPATSSTWYSITGTDPLPGQCMDLWNGFGFTVYNFDEFDSTWNYTPDPINGPPIPIGGAIFVGCGEIPPIPEPAAGLITLGFGAILFHLRRTRLAR